MTLEKVEYTANSLAPIRCSFLSTLVAAGAFGLVLLAAPCYAQTVPAADGRAFVISPLPAKLGAAAEDTAVRPVRINIRKRHSSKSYWGMARSKNLLSSHRRFNCAWKAFVEVNYAHPFWAHRDACHLAKHSPHLLYPGTPLFLTKIS